MSIKVKIELMAALPRPTGERTFELELAQDKSSVQDLLSTLDFSVEEQRHLIVMVNGEQVSKTKAQNLSDGDEVFITTLIGGG